MRSLPIRLFACLACLSIFCIPAFAVGPVDGEVGAVWWSNDLDMQSGAASSSTDGSAPGFRAELWMIDKFGVRAMQYSSDTDALGASDADYTSVDVMWRPFSPSKNNFVAVGLGWQQNDFGVDGDTSGPRVAFEGRIGFIDTVYGYGQGTYAPSLDDSSSTTGDSFDDLDGYEYELGVAWNAMPFMSVRAGYRSTTVDFTQVGTGGGAMTPTDGSVESTGFFGGLGFRF